MKQLVYFSIILLLISCNNESKKDYELLPVEVEDRWGYVDHQGQYIINPQYGKAYVFSDGLARVKDFSNDNYGFIDKEGNTIIEPKFLSASDFVNGVSVVSVEDSKVFIINKKGENIATLDSVSISYGFSEKLAAVKIKNSKWGYVNTSGELVVKPKYLEAGSFKEGLSKVRIDSSELLYAFINKKGKIIIQPKYSEVGDFNNGLAKFKLNKLWGYIDKSGEVVINPQFDSCENFNGDTAPVKLGEKWGFIDEKGKYIINPQYDWAGKFSNSLAAVKSGDKYGYIDLKGDFIVNPQFQNAEEFYDDVAFIMNDDKYGLINNEGKIVVNPQFFSSYWEFRHVYEYVYNAYNSVKSDFFDKELIVNSILDKVSIEKFFNVTKNTTAQELIDSEKNIYVGIKSISLKDEIILSDGAKITDIYYNFPKNFKSYEKQYRKRNSYGYEYTEYVGQKEVVDYSSVVKSILVYIEISKKEKTDKVLDKLKNDFKDKLNVEHVSFSISKFSNGIIKLEITFN